MSTEDAKARKWTQEEIENIVDERIRKCLPKNVSEQEYHRKIEELERQLKESDHSVELIEKQYNTKLSKLSEEFNHKEKNYIKYINELEKQISDYQGYFEGIFRLYQKSCDILTGYDDTVLKKISLENPISFIVSISNEKNISSYYDYIMYEFSDLNPEIIDLFHELLEFMCQMNTEYSLIDNDCLLDDSFHIEKNRKHTGMINHVLVKGYKYTVSGKAVKKSFVEV